MKLLMALRVTARVILWILLFVPACLVLFVRWLIFKVSFTRRMRSFGVEPRIARAMVSEYSPVAMLKTIQ